jgi:hypothetical protein
MEKNGGRLFRRLKLTLSCSAERMKEMDIFLIPNYVPLLGIVVPVTGRGGP